MADNTGKPQSYLCGRFFHLRYSETKKRLGCDFLGEKPKLKKKGGGNGRHISNYTPSDLAVVEAKAKAYQNLGSRIFGSYLLFTTVNMSSCSWRQIKKCTVKLWFALGKKQIKTAQNVSTTGSCQRNALQYT